MEEMSTVHYIHDFFSASVSVILNASVKIIKRGPTPYPVKPLSFGLFRKGCETTAIINDELL
jgi:hypothetical protein